MLLNITITYLFLWALMFLFLFVVAVFYLTSLNKKKVLYDAFLLGGWERKGQSPDGSSWFMKYVFSKTQVEITGKPDYFARGDYRIVKEDENLMILELANMIGDEFETPGQLAIAINRKKDVLTINGRSQYYRVNKK